MKTKTKKSDLMDEIKATDFLLEQADAQLHALTQLVTTLLEMAEIDVGMHLETRYMPTYPMIDLHCDDDHALELSGETAVNVLLGACLQEKSRQKKGE